MIRKMHSLFATRFMRSQYPSVVYYYVQFLYRRIPYSVMINFMSTRHKEFKWKEGYQQHG